MARHCLVALALASLLATTLKASCASLNTTELESRAATIGDVTREDLVAANHDAMSENSKHVDTSPPASNSTSLARRHERFFPIYTVVRFRNSQCAGNNALVGTCYLKNECAKAGGVASGVTCARRLGICCIVTRNCGGSVISSNNTYYRNPGFPSTYSGGARCTITIKRIDSSVCYVRLTFSEFILPQPNAQGNCDAVDYLSVSGTDTVVPRICGTNTGQHLYLKFKPGDTDIQVGITFNSSVTFQRKWDILVTQHNCSEAIPDGCLQYHTGITGTVSSFNYAETVTAASTRQLKNQQYAVCVRPGDGYCGIEWRQASSTAFTVSGDTTGAGAAVGTPDGSTKGDVCTGDYVVIPAAMQGTLPANADRFCGNALPPTQSINAPMVLTVVTDETEVATDVDNRGFQLNYRQVECSS